MPNQRPFVGIEAHLRKAEDYWNSYPAGHVDDRTIADIFDILGDIVAVLHDVDWAAYHANNTAAWLANGILPD